MSKMFWHPGMVPVLVAGVFSASAMGCGKGDGSTPLPIVVELMTRQGGEVIPPNYVQ